MEDTLYEYGVDLVFNGHVSYLAIVRYKEKVNTLIIMLLWWLVAVKALNFTYHKQPDMYIILRMMFIYI
jgi:hypothetical protein